MSARNILVDGYAKKNKSRKKKYFVLSTYFDYSDPRLDYFINKEKWNEGKHEIDNKNSENKSYQSIDLSNLFFVDDIHRSKSKLKGLNLYMEDRHLTLIFLSEELKKKWKEYFENIIYKNSKSKPFYKSGNIEHVLEVSIRLKPKENIDKSVFSLLRGSFRACFTKSLLMFVNKSLECPTLTIQYPFIRQWESRYDGTFRLEIGRAALIGECILILQLADYEDSKAAHAKLTKCINSFKLTKPDPPKIRNQFEKTSKRSSMVSCSSKPIPFINNNESIHKRHDSCITFGTESLNESSSMSWKLDSSINGNPSCSADDSNYVPMNDDCDSSPNKSSNVLDYFEHTNRIYKCPNCGCFTKLIIYCSKCCNGVPLNTLNLLCKSDPNSDPNSFELQPHLFGPTRNKAQSLTDKPNRFSSTCLNKTKQFLSDPSKPTASNNSKSSSKTSTNDASISSKQESQNSLAISANRHDDEIFMELDFDNLSIRKFSNLKMSTNCRQLPQLKCANCQTNLVHRTPGDNIFGKPCSICSEELVILSIPIKDTVIGSDWRPRTTSLVPPTRPRVPVNSIAASIINTSTQFKSYSHHNEYVDVTSD